MLDAVKIDHHPRFDPIGGANQDFPPFPITLPRLGSTIAGPAKEMLTMIAVTGDGQHVPMIVIADSVSDGAPALAMAFSPSREQARRMARTLLDFAEGREADLVREARG